MLFSMSHCQSPATIPDLQHHTCNVEAFLSHSPPCNPGILTLGIASRGEHSDGPTYPHLCWVSGFRLSHGCGAGAGCGKEAENERKLSGSLLHSARYEGAPLL